MRNLNPAMQLRPYQKECLQYFLTYWREDFDGKEIQSHLLFHMATGSGKTLIMAALILYMYEMGYRNFLFFVNNTNIIEKTRDNLLNSVSMKYLFAPSIEFKGHRVEINSVENFQNSDKDCINLCLTTTQGLHDSMNTPHENAVTYDDFQNHKIVMISDEAHHINASTKKGKAVAVDGQALFSGADMDTSDDWETTVMRIFRMNPDNALFEFTATEDFQNEFIAKKYENKVLFDYPLKKFREDRYSKDIEVVQSDLLPIERVLQAVVLNQYKRKLFESIGHDIKPVMMLKSRTKNENSLFYSKFISSIKDISEDTFSKIRERASGDIAGAFEYFDEKGITAENLIMEIREDFKEENLLLVDGNNISAEKQLLLNSLESKDNGYRVVFAVDMLNEGWDVLNLYDIVRLYDTRDSKDGKVGKTTMQEAQLIGRGARYMPFRLNKNDSAEVACMRKFDNDITNRLRVIEKLHYHSASNPKYISELHQAMVQTGIIPPRTKEIHLKIKESFKNTGLYRNGYVFGNRRESFRIDGKRGGIGCEISEKVFRVMIHSGEMHSTIILDDAGASAGNIMNSSVKALTMKGLGTNVLRAAMNRIRAYSFEKLKGILPELSSLDEMMTSSAYLADVRIDLHGRQDILDNLTQKHKLSVALDVLMQIEPMLGKSAVGYRGTKEFEPVGMVKDIFKDKTIKVSIDEGSDKEFGRSMSETELFPPMDLRKCDWYAFEDCYGTSEEKYFIKYFASILPKLEEKYEDVYLVRNECELKIYELKSGVDGGKVFEPDYLLFMRKKDDQKYENLQIFIEPKGSHLKEKDAWKQEFLKEINSDSSVEFSTLGGESFRIIGLPFYNEKQKSAFDGEFKEQLGVGAW